MTTSDGLNEAYRDLLEAAKRVQRMTGTSIHIGVHNLERDDFNAADFVASDFPNEDGDPSYGYVKGHEMAYLCRRLYRGSGVVFETYMDTVPGPEFVTS